jgi:hypothetical protein
MSMKVYFELFDLILFNVINLILYIFCPIYVHIYIYIYIFPMARQPNMGLGLLVLSRFHDHTLNTPQSVGLLWTSDQPVAETST